jgi:hypothetical protein
MKTLVFFLFAILLVVGFASAQMHPLIQAEYTENIPFHQEVISGGYYVDPPNNIEGHPYLRDKKFEIGNITINGLFYEQVPILYDIHKDLIITFHPLHRQKTIIQAEKINSFSILEPQQIKFVKIEDSFDYGNHNNGFYELVIDGNAQLFCKHFKTVNSKKETGKYSRIFIEDFDFMLKKGNEFLLVKKRKDVFEFLGLEKKAIQKELKSKDVFFQRSPRAYLSTVTEFFNDQEK